MRCALANANDGETPSANTSPGTLHGELSVLQSTMGCMTQRMPSRATARA